MTWTVSLFFFTYTRIPTHKSFLCVWGVCALRPCAAKCWTERNKQAERKREGHRQTKNVYTTMKIARETEVRDGGGRGSQWYFELTTEPVNCCCHCFRDATSHSSSTQLQTFKRRTQRESERWTAFRSPPIYTISDMTEEAAVPCHGHPSLHSERPIGQNRQQRSRRGRGRERLCRRVFGKLLTNFF